MSIELRIPSAGESITEVEIGEWRKSEGDSVKRDEVVVEIETDKASMELAAPSDGVLSKVLKKAGEPAKVNEVIAFIEPGPAGKQRDRDRDGSRAQPDPAQEKQQQPVKKQDQAAPRAEQAAPPPAKSSAARIMPAAQRALAEQGLKPDDLEGTGPGGRILKEDVQRHAEQKAEPVREKASPQAHGDREEEVVPMTLLRRRIASRLVEAQQTAALLTTFNEVDMGPVQALRNEYRDAFERKYNIKLGIMSFFVKAAIDALKLIPAVNAEIRENAIVYKNYFDIGVAVATDKGLVVPVIRNAERLSFAEIEQAIANFAVRARENKLSVDELAGGTFTITNGGIFGSLLSTPIVNPPQSGILGLHAMQDRPVAREGQVVIRPMMYVAMTYDHRIVDGKEAVTFLRRIKECIETPARMLVEV
jgi:2-oxoglutarate dehydrogenase E2 component (dihydrolipoamide succinyltransferase)